MSMKKISVHDNEIYAYLVLCKEHKIILYTEFPDENNREYTDIIFSGVVVHYFECAITQNVIFDIAEIEPSEIYHKNKDLFSELKDCYWPEIEYKSDIELLGKLKEMNIKGFVIDSTFGLCGWVLAKEMQLQSRKEKANL